MRAYEFLTEAKPENLGQTKLDQLFATYQKRDIRDNTLPEKYTDGLGVAGLIFQYIGPKNLIWVVNQYIKDNYFFLHDLPQWKSDLEEFTRLTRSSRIQVNKDINSYTSINQLRDALNAIKNQSQELGSNFYSKAISSIDEFVKHGDADWLYRGNDYSIYQPLSFESSNICKNFNISVRVCTIMNDDNFYDYIDYGTLLYIIDQNKIYICYISKDLSKMDPEFSDEQNNHDYDLAWQLDKFPALRGILQKVEFDPNDLELKIEFAPDDEKYQIALEAVKQRGYVLEYIPMNLRTTELCLIAVKKNGLALDHVPVHLRTPEIYLAAVNDYGLTLRLVPKNLRTRELCLAAVKENSGALEHVPDHLRSEIESELGL